MSSTNFENILPSCVASTRTSRRPCRSLWITESRPFCPLRHKVIWRIPRQLPKSRIRSTASSWLSFHSMLSRNWLHCIVTGCLVACILANGVTLAQQQGSLGSNTATQKAEKEPSAKPSPSQSATTHFEPGIKVDEHTYAAICDQPKDRDHADLCQQWRMAEATRTQIWLTILGLALLAGTLVFTAIAARAARDAVREAEAGTKAARIAAEATIQANNITRQNFIESERPRLILSNFSIEKPLHFTDGKWSITVKYTAKNTGKSPAVGVMFWSKLYALKEGTNYSINHAQFITEQPNRIRFENTVVPGAPHTGSLTALKVDDPEYTGATKENFFPIILGFIEYEFTFDSQRRITPFTIMTASFLPDPTDFSAVEKVSFVLAPSPIRPT